MKTEQQNTQQTSKKQCDKHPFQDLPCLICDESERRERERREHPEILLEDLGVGKRYLACDFDSYQGGDKVKDILRHFLEDPGDITICGGTGLGKTHLAVSTFRELIKAGKLTSSFSEFYSRTGCFITAADLLAEIRASYRDYGPKESDIINEYSSVRYLVLDDLGAEKTSDWSISTLYIIIDRRHRAMLPTIVTTNLTIDEISAQLNPRIASRLSSGKVIKLSGTDYRTKRGQK